MKIMFFDVLKNSNKIIKIEDNINSFSSVYVYINENIIKDNNMFNKFKNKLKSIYLSKLFKKKFTDEYLYVMSYEFEKNCDLKNIVVNAINDNFVEVIQPRTMINNSIKYIEKFDKCSKLLCIISEDIDTLLILKYIEIFKQVDILYLNYKVKNYTFFKIINNINQEYGTSISFVKDLNIKNYDIYLAFSKVDLNSYIINHKSKYIDLTNNDNDIYSKEYSIYIKYKEELKCVDNYSKTKIGSAILNLLDK